MVEKNVNKTALHPHGVAPPVEHTEIEEELHTRAHIDYDRVAIIANPSVPALYEDALVYETGSAITSSGALSAYSGAKTGRSPSDKRIVKEADSENEIWWGPVNKPMTPEVWHINRERALDYLNTRNRIYVIDGYAGWDERYRISVRVVCARAYHALFMRNMLIRPSRKDLEHFHPDYVIYNAGDFPANRYTTGMTSSTSVAINFHEKELVILGTSYAESQISSAFAIRCVLPSLHFGRFYGGHKTASSMDPLDPDLSSPALGLYASSAPSRISESGRLDSGYDLLFLLTSRMRETARCLLLPDASEDQNMLSTACSTPVSSQLPFARAPLSFHLFTIDMKFS